MLANGKLHIRLAIIDKKIIECSTLHIAQVELNLRVLIALPQGL